MANNRLQRIKDLQKTTADYIKAERDRVNSELKVLDAILNGRTGGAGIQQVSVTVVVAVANKDLDTYLQG